MSAEMGGHILLMSMLGSMIILVAMKGQECPAYGCRLHRGVVCVQDPTDCPCPPSQFKCVYSDGGDFICLPGEKHCAALKRNIRAGRT